MRYHVLAADYDETLAHAGRIADTTWAALHRLCASGRKLVLVTGRELEDVLALIREPELFARIVAENGAVLYRPDSKEIRMLAEPPPPSFVEELRARGVDQLAVGRVIVASREPHQDTVLHAIRDLGLELQVIFNKGAVMVLPSGINKATGLAAALGQLALSPHNAVGVGDAENDHALLVTCECGVAVANALPALRDKADLVTAQPGGDGVAELIDRLVAGDLAEVGPQLVRHRIQIGSHDIGSHDNGSHDNGSRDNRSHDNGSIDRAAITFDPYAANLLVCGTSGSGKSTLTTGLLERLAGAGYQFAIIDPEGDHVSLDGAVVLGGQQREPLVEEMIDVVRDPSHNVVVNLLWVAASQRPECFARVLAALAEFRVRTGRPHWLVVDEAHHVVPAERQPAADPVAVPSRGVIYVTVHPGSVARAILGTLDTVLIVGERPRDTLVELCRGAGRPVPAVREIERLATGQALYWRVGEPDTAVIRIEPPKHERRRHSRKYAEGNLGQARSFYFRGAEAKLNLRAHNLQMFVQLGDGVDDDTWQYHRRCGDYSRWFRDQVKDDQLAREAEAIERSELTASDSRAAIRAAVEQRYTLPSDAPSGRLDVA
jgi:HAD superfamily hydrolase (TIGR01484 family)